MPTKNISDPITLDPRSPELSYLDEDKKLSYTPECLKRFIKLGANKIFGALKLKVSDQDREAILHIIEKGLIKKEELNDWEKILLFCLWKEKKNFELFLKEIFNKGMLYTGPKPLEATYDEYISNVDEIISSFWFDTSIGWRFINSNHTPSKLLWETYSKRSDDGKYFYFENGEIKPLVLRYEGKEFFPKLRLNTDKEKITLPTGESFQEAYIHRDEGGDFYFLLDKNLQPIQYQLDWETYFLDKVSYYEQSQEGYYFLHEISKKLLRVEFRKFTWEAVKSTWNKKRIQVYVTEDMKPVEYQYCWKTYCLMAVFGEKNIWGKFLYDVCFWNSNYDKMSVYLTEDLQPWKKTIGGEEWLLSELNDAWKLFRATFLNKENEEMRGYMTPEGEVLYREDKEKNCYVTPEGKVLSYFKKNGEETIVKNVDNVSFSPSGKVLTYFDQNGKEMLVGNLEKVRFMSGTDLEKPLVFIDWTWDGGVMLGNKEELGEGNEEELGNKEF